MMITRGCLRVGMLSPCISLKEPKKADTPKVDHHKEGQNRPGKNISKK